MIINIKTAWIIHRIVRRLFQKAFNYACQGRLRSCTSRTVFQQLGLVTAHNKCLCWCVLMYASIDYTSHRHFEELALAVYLPYFLSHKSKNLLQKTHLRRSCSGRLVFCLPRRRRWRRALRELPDPMVLGCSPGCRARSLVPYPRETRICDQHRLHRT